jgi:hypothetical protein
MAAGSSAATGPALIACTWLRVTFQQAFESAAARDMHRSSATSALDRLAEYLATVE